MKHNYLYIVAAIITFSVVFVACKKERGPRLIVHVQELDGTPAVGADVHAWYGQSAGQTGSALNDIEMDQRALTDSEGNATFDFKFSAVLDVDVEYLKHGLDTALNPIIDTLYGHRVVKIEAVRQKSKINDHNETVEVK